MKKAQAEKIKIYASNNHDNLYSEIEKTIETVAFLEFDSLKTRYPNDCCLLSSGKIETLYNRITRCFLSLQAELLDKDENDNLETTIHAHEARLQGIISEYASTQLMFIQWVSKIFEKVKLLGENNTFDPFINARLSEISGDLKALQAQELSIPQKTSNSKYSLRWPSFHRSSRETESSLSAKLLEDTSVSSDQKNLFK